MLKTAVFELMQQFYHATEIGNVASAVSPCAAQPQQAKQGQLFRIKWTIAENNLKHAWWTNGLQKVVRWFLGGDDNPDSDQNLLNNFWPIYNVPWNLHANSFRGICIKSTN